MLGLYQFWFILYMFFIFGIRLNLMVFFFTLLIYRSRWAMFDFLCICWFGPIGPTLVIPCQRASTRASFLRAYWVYLGSSLPTSKSLDIIALGILGLPWAYLANEQILGYPGSGPIGPTLGLPCQRANPRKSSLWAYCAYLGLTLPTRK